MRPSQHGKKPRGRGRKQHNPLSRVYDSNGPDVKIRGTASHIADKYLNLARDAHSAGDRIAAESYFQHAEHYFRIIAAAQGQMGPVAQPAGEQPQSEESADQPMSAENGGGMRDEFGRDSQHFEGRSRRGRRRNGMRQGDSADDAPGAQGDGQGDGQGAGVSNEPETASAANGGGDAHRPDDQRPDAHRPDDHRPDDRTAGSSRDDEGTADRSEPDPDPGTINA